MTTHKKTVAETRDREVDLKALADAFFRDLSCGETKKGKDFWKFQPQVEKFHATMVEFVLSEIQYVEGECPECGTVIVDEDETSDISEEAKAYAEDLWTSLGMYLEDTWHELHEAVASADLCIECGCEVDADGQEGPFVCEDCENDEVSDEDEDEDVVGEEEVCYSCDEPLDSDGICQSCTCPTCFSDYDYCTCDDDEEEECD